MTFTGLDLHKKEVEAVLLAEDGRVLHRSRFPATRSALEAFAAAHLSALDSVVAVEATTNNARSAGRRLTRNRCVTRPVNRFSRLGCASSPSMCSIEFSAAGASVDTVSSVVMTQTRLSTS